MADVKNRTSTTDEPFISIKGAVRHWDEHKLFANETTPELPPDLRSSSGCAEAGVEVCEGMDGGVEGREAVAMNLAAD